MRRGYPPAILPTSSAALWVSEIWVVILPRSVVHEAVRWSWCRAREIKVLTGSRLGPDGEEADKEEIGLTGDNGNVSEKS